MSVELWVRGSSMLLGHWWLETVAYGRTPTIPIVNVDPEIYQSWDHRWYALNSEDLRWFKLLLTNERNQRNGDVFESVASWLRLRAKFWGTNISQGT
jgi:hypothetical protein